MTTSWKAVAEIYTMHSFAPLWTALESQSFLQNLHFFGNINFARFLLILREFLTLGAIFWNL